MFNKHSVSLEWAGRTLTIETGQVARQADGAVMVQYGDTLVLATAVFAKEAKPGQDFFPLTVNYQEKYFASGRIPGGYFKREGRPTEKETLTSRLIDRPIRPLFVNGFKNEVQVVVTTLSYDLENDPDIVGMIGASAALVLSGAPFMDPIGAARMQRWLSVAAGQVAFGLCAARLVNIVDADYRPEEVIARAHAILTLIEAELDGQDWIAADRPTVADVALYSYVARAPEGNVDLAAYANVRAWLERIEALPGFVPFERTPVGLDA